MRIVKLLYRSISSTTVQRSQHQLLRHGQRLLHLSPRPFLPNSSKPPAFDINRLPYSPTAMSARYYSEDVVHMPAMDDPEIANPYKDLMAASWDELPDALIHDVKKAMSKNIDDKVGQEVLQNVYHAAEAVEEFGGMLVSMRMEIDDSIGLSGEVTILGTSVISGSYIEQRA